MIGKKFGSLGISVVNPQTWGPSSANPTDPEIPQYYRTLFESIIYFHQLKEIIFVSPVKWGKCLNHQM